MVKSPPANAGDLRDLGLIPGLARSPVGGNDNPLQYSCLENSHGQRSMTSYSPRGCKESELSEQLGTQIPNQPNRWEVCEGHCSAWGSHLAPSFLRDCVLTSLGRSQ